MRLTIKTFVELFIVDAISMSEHFLSYEEKRVNTSNLAPPSYSVLTRSRLFVSLHPST